MRFTSLVTQRTVCIVTDLSKRLSQNGNTVTATDAPNSPSDQSYYPGLKCYVVGQYTYGALSGQTCKAQGGNYYRDASAADLSTRLSQSGNTVTATAINNPSDQAYYSGLNCYKIGSYTYGSGTTCSSQGGKWYSGYGSCGDVQAAWNPNGYSNDTFSAPKQTPSDSRTGAVCCVENAQP